MIYLITQFLFLIGLTYAQNNFESDIDAIQKDFIPGIINVHLQNDLKKIETKYWDFLIKDDEESIYARKKLQYFFSQSQLATKLPVEMPLSQKSFWHKEVEISNNNYQSTQNLPKSMDIVIIGGGLSGASIAYHLGKRLEKYYKLGLKDKKIPNNLFSQKSDFKLKQKFFLALKKGKYVYLQTSNIDQALKTCFEFGPQITLVDSFELVAQASGKNGGNIHSIPEVFLDDYQDLITERKQFIKNVWPNLSEKMIENMANFQAEEIIKIAKWTRKLIAKIPLDEQFNADFSPGGWLRIAESIEEYQGLIKEQELLDKADLQSSMLSPEQIEEIWHYKPQFGGRFTPKDATYHPYKFAMGLINAARSKFNLQIYTHTKILNISSTHLLKTARGNIQAAKVVLATNAFTKFLIDYKFIFPVLSQIMCTDFMPNKTNGGLVTEKSGHIYYHQPESLVGENFATLLMGGPDVFLSDKKIKSDTQIYNLQPLKWVHDEILAHRNKVFPFYKNVPPSAEWAGPMAFTPDRLPVIGEYSKNIFITAGFNGFGGTYTIGAGKSIAKIMLTNKSSKNVNLEIFDPNRFL